MDSFSPDLSQVDPALRDQIQQIVAACRVTPEQAFQSLLLNDFLVDSSISALKSSRSNRIPSELDLSFIEGASFEDSDQEYQPYFYYGLGQKKKYFYEKYPVKVQLIKSRTQILKEDTKFNCHPRLGEVVREEFLPKSYVSSLEEALCVSYNDKIPVLILNSDFSQVIQPHLLELFSLAGFTEKLNTQFIFFCIDETYTIERWLVPLLNVAPNEILMIRTNLFDDVEVVMRVQLQKEAGEVMQAVKKGKATSIQRALDDKYIKMKHKMTKEGKFWKRPVSFRWRSRQKEEQRRLLSHRKLMKQQEQDFKQVVNNLQEEKIKQDQKQEQEESSKAEYLKQLQKKKAGLQTYHEGIEFKIRVPSGTNIFVRAPREERVQYLSDVIECREEDLGFERNVPRKFDLCVGLNCRESLGGQGDQRIGDVLGESAFLVVRERE